jgi:hypothetical protein
MLRKDIMKFHEDHPNLHDIYVLTVHSEATIIARNTVEDLPDEVQERVVIIAISQAVCISNEDCKAVDHYMSTRDIIPLCSMGFRMASEQGTLHVLPAHKDAPLYDHGCESPTFNPAEEKIKSYATH